MLKNKFGILQLKPSFKIPGCYPNLDLNCKVSLKSDWLIGMLFQEHDVLGEITLTPYF